MTRPGQIGAPEANASLVPARLHGTYPWAGTARVVDGEKKEGECVASPITPSGLPYLTDGHVTHVTLLRTDSTRPRVSGQKRACSSLGVRPGNVALPVKRSVSAVESRTSRIPNEPLGDDAPVLGRQAPRRVGSKPILYLEYTDVPFCRTNKRSSALWQNQGARRKTGAPAMEGAARRAPSVPSPPPLS